MYNKYLIETFIPWSLKVDYKNSIKLLEKEKEKFICDMYNHFASSFKQIASYELHMFRVTTSKINTLGCDLISIKLPDQTYHSIYIVYNNDSCNYFIVNRKLELISDGKVIDVLNSDLSNLNSLITNYIFSK